MHQLCNIYYYCGALTIKLLITDTIILQRETNKTILINPVYLGI